MERTKDAAMLRQARLDKGMTVAEVAAATGMSESSIRRVETRGLRHVLLSRVYKLSEALEVSLDDLAMATLQQG